MLTERGSRLGTSRRTIAERRRRPGILDIIQNLSLVLDRRVRMECEALLSAGYRVSVRQEGGPQPAIDELDDVAEPTGCNGQPVGVRPLQACLTATPSRRSTRSYFDLKKSLT